MSPLAERLIAAAELAQSASVQIVIEVHSSGIYLRGRMRRETDQKLLSLEAVVSYEQIEEARENTLLYHVSEIERRLVEAAKTEAA